LVLLDGSDLLLQELKSMQEHDMQQRDTLDTNAVALPSLGNAVHASPETQHAGWNAILTARVVCQLMTTATPP
jgi:hypothetical protein